MLRADAELEAVNGQSGRGPKYEQVASLLRRAIAEGEYPVGSKLPSVRQLSQDLDLSPPTAFRAIQELAREGLVVSHAGPKGTIVIRDEPASEVKPTTLACLLRPHRPRNEADNFALDMIQGMRNEVSSAHYRFVYHCTDEVDYERRMIALAREPWVCGVLMDQYPSPTIVRTICGLGLPAVIMNHRLDEPNLSSVAPDYVRLARGSVRLFMAAGYERVGFASVMADESTWGEDGVCKAYPSLTMRRGFRVAAAAAGLSESDIFWVVEQDAPVLATPEFFGLPRRKPPDWRRLGIFCDTDRRAVALIEAIGQTDLVLGEDIGVIGCYDLIAGRRAPTPPSTWRIDPLAVGGAAAAELIGRIEDPDSPASFIKLPAEFVSRGTF